MIEKAKANALRKYFLDHAETVAVAESVTSGLLQLEFSGIPDAEKFYQGGITTYNLGQKYKHLNVEPIHAVNCNCISQQVANQMALNVCPLFLSEWGIGITGFATPTKESQNKIFCFYAIAVRGQIISSSQIISKKLKPREVQQFYCDEIINDLLNKLESF